MRKVMSDPTTTTKIETLVTLAADTSATGRTELLSRVTDLFIESGGAFSEQETLHVQEIMNSLARTVGSDARQKLAHKLGGLENASRQVVVRLANDGVEVARPILARSPVLEDQDLDDVINSQTQDHMLAIAERDHINEQVVDALAEKGNDDVLVSLASNHNAQLSKPTTVHLVGCSQTVEPLQKTADRTNRYFTGLDVPNLLVGAAGHTQTTSRPYQEPRPRRTGQIVDGSSAWDNERHCPTGRDLEPGPATHP